MVDSISLVAVTNDDSLDALLEVSPLASQREIREAYKKYDLPCPPPPLPSFEDKVFG